MLRLEGLKRPIVAPTFVAKETLKEVKRGTVKVIDLLKVITRWQKMDQDGLPGERKKWVHYLMEGEAMLIDDSEAQKISSVGRFNSVHQKTSVVRS